MPLLQPKSLSPIDCVLSLTSILAFVAVTRRRDQLLHLLMMVNFLSPSDPRLTSCSELRKRQSPQLTPLPQHITLAERAARVPPSITVAYLGLLTQDELFEPTGILCCGLLHVAEHVYDTSPAATL